MFPVPFNAEGRKLTRWEAKYALEQCRQRDGCGCQAVPGKRGYDTYPCKGDSILHHIDGDSTHNPPDGSNWEELCRGHNARKNPRGRAYRDGASPFHRNFNKFNEKNIVEKEKERGWQGENEWAWEQRTIMPATMRKNQSASPAFKKVLKAYIAKYGIRKRKDVLDTCSELAGCTQQTGARYLDCLCSEGGKFKYEVSKETGEMLVMVRPEEERFKIEVLKE